MIIMRQATSWQKKNIVWRIKYMSDYKNYNDNNLHSDSDNQRQDNVTHTDSLGDRHYHNDNSGIIDGEYRMTFNNRNEEYEEPVYTSHCFKEKIKTKKIKSKKPRVFRKVVAVLLIAMLSGGAFQVGSAVTKPLVNRYVKKDNSNFSFNNGIQQTNSADSQGTLTELNSKYTDTTNGAYVSPVVKIAENVRPSIVTITTTVASRDWFNNQLNQQGTGSGIIFGENDKEIHIVTNYHVIKGANKVDITFSETETITANLVGYEADYDLAVLSVSKKDMKKELLDSIRIAKLGDSKNIKVGELAVAIGNPLGQGETVTVGYISAVNRTLGSVDKNLPYLQTDAAINPGNSGGALVNSRSEVIGINSMKLASTEVEGMGFAIPITEAKPIIEDIMNQVSRPVLGIKGQNITNEMAQAYNIPIGVLVRTVEPNSGAYKGGIQPNDIIYEFGGITIFNFDELSAELKKYEAGDTVSVKVNRKEGNRFKQVELKIKLSDQRTLMYQP